MIRLPESRELALAVMSPENMIREFGVKDLANDPWNFFLTLEKPGINPPRSPIRGKFPLSGGRVQERLYVPPERELEFWMNYDHLIRSGFDIKQRLPEAPTVMFEFNLPQSIRDERPGTISILGRVLTNAVKSRVNEEVDPILVMMSSGERLRFHFPLIRVSSESQKNDLLPEVTQALVRAGFEPDGVVDYDLLSGSISLLGSHEEKTGMMWRDPVFWNERQGNFGTLMQRGLLEFPSNEPCLGQQAYLFSAAFVDEVSTTPRVVVVKSDVQRYLLSLILIDDQADMAEKLLPMIAPARLQIPREFKEIGQAIFSSFRGEAKGLKLWIDATERSQRVLGGASFCTAAHCKELYPTFAMTSISVKTLGWYARLDQPRAYQNWMDEWTRRPYELCASHSHVDVCYVLRRTFWLDYVCAGIGKNLWYRFSDHTWIPLDCGSDFKRTIREEFLVLLSEVCGHLESKTSAVEYENEEDDEKQSSPTEKLIERYINLIKRLKNQDYKNKIYREAMEHFYDGNFMRKLDANPRIMGLFNGVVEADTREVVFRHGKPDDYITKYAPISFDPNLTWDSPRVVEVMNWLDQLFCSDQLRDYFIKLQCSIFLGRNVGKIIEVWEGTRGNNGKSTMKKMLEELGPYCIDFPRGFLSTSARGGGPTPEIAQMAGARVAFVQEPEGELGFLAGLLKELSGGDSFWGRFLNQNGGKIKNTVKLIIICNVVPNIKDSSLPMKSRVRIVPWNSAWVEDAPENPADQWKSRLFPIDPTFEERIPILAPAFFWILMQYFPRYIDEGVKPPEEVIKATDHYWSDHDQYQGFIEYHLQRTDDPNDNQVELFHLIPKFREWWETKTGTRAPDEPSIKKEFENRLDPEDGRVPGYRWISRLPLNPGANRHHAYTSQH